MRFFFLVLLLLSGGYGYTQKKLIDSSSYSEWTRLSNPILSNNGKYLFYSVDSNNRKNSYQILASTFDDWSITLRQGDGLFVNKDKCFLFKSIGGESVDIIWLGTSKRTEIPAKSFSVPGYQDRRHCIYQKKDDNSLYIFNISSGKTSIVPNLGNIIEYGDGVINGNVILVVRDEAGNTNLKSLNIISGKSKIINDQFSIDQYSLGKKGVAFLNKNNESEIGMYYYTANNDLLKRYSLTSLFDDKSQNISLLGLSQDETSVQLAIENSKSQKDKPVYEGPELDLWSYKDDELPGFQPMLGTRNGQIVTVSLKDGSLLKGSLIEDSAKIFNQFKTDSLLKIGELSASSNFLIFSDGKDYWSYELSTGKTRNLTNSVSTSWFSTENGDCDVFIEKGGVVAWLDNESVAISDEYDIWLLSLNGKFYPINLTNGYGNKNKVRFYLLNGKGTEVETPVLKLKDEVIFVAFDTKLKRNGFYSKRNFLTKGDPTMLTMENAMFWLPFAPLSFPAVVTSNLKPVRAKNAPIYLVAKSTAKESMNYYVTTDFKKFRRISNNFPERKFNWLSTELVSWTTDKGISLQGILYKPEDFDPQKKYPVIFYFYRKASANLNAYMQPLECPGCMIDIPTYVSNGYLVFTPDIYFVEGQTGQSALAAIESGAQKLMSFPYVNSQKLGIQGCSFSGFTTNYIVTHSNMFAAACSASGLSDFISGYNSINKTGAVKQSHFEQGGPYQMGGTLWDRLGEYIENSAVLSTNHLATPLLLMHTTSDVAIPVSNAIEFFLAGRRLNKKIWLLQYGGMNNHVVLGKEGVDFNRRMRQFFDFYLKDSLPPTWMTLGRPEKLKGIDERLTLDSTGRQP